MLSSVSKLIAVIRHEKIVRSHGLGRIPAFVQELCLRREIDLPSRCLEAFTEIHVLIHRRVELLVEPTYLIISVPPDHQRRTCRLVDDYWVLRGMWGLPPRPLCQAFRESEVFADKRSDGGKGPRPIFFADV